MQYSFFSAMCTVDAAVIWEENMPAVATSHEYLDDLLTLDKRKFFFYSGMRNSRAINI
jgi:hypothetical protein